MIAPPTGATVAADLMNVLYAGFNNPISVTAAGGNAGVHLSMTGGTLTQTGPGKYTARPAKVGENVTFTVSGTVNGKAQKWVASPSKCASCPILQHLLKWAPTASVVDALPKAPFLGLQA